MTAVEYIPDFAHRLNLSSETVLKAHRILESDATFTGSGVEPRAVAAAILHVAGGFTGETRTPSEVIAAAGITAADLEMNVENVEVRVGLRNRL